MEQLLLVIPALICPIGMGLCMWMMAKHMGGSKKQAEQKAPEVSAQQPVTASADQRPVSKI